MLRDKSGRIINIGGGVRNDQDGGLLITGTAEFEKTAEGDFVIYQGTRYESTAERPVATTGSASTVHPVDWDGDGDHDLIIGNFGGGVYLVPNEGTAKSYDFGKEKELMAGNGPIKVRGKAGPCVADWDMDGDLDLLVGADDGSVSLFRNVGTAKAPKLAAPIQLIPPGDASYGPDVPKEVRRGTRSKICVADWNGDGRPDLLVGDMASQKPDVPEPAAEQKAEHERIRKELEPMRQRYSELVQRLRGPSRPRTKAGSEKLQKELQEVRDRMMELHRKLPPEYETHGWVWLFLRPVR